MYFTVCVLYLNKNIEEKKKKADSTSSPLEGRRVSLKSPNMKRESNIYHTEPLRFILKRGWMGEEKVEHKRKCIYGPQKGPTD